MNNKTPLKDDDFLETLATHEREQRIRTNKVAALLVAVLMPAGVTLDWVVYGAKGFVWPFLILRLISSVFATGIWFLLATQTGHRHHRFIGILIALMPAFFIAIMIYMTNDPGSSYYAGLNLIVLAISVVVRWNVIETIIAVTGVLLMYLVTCLLIGAHGQFSNIFNNYYFLILTGIIVVIGNHFFTELRLREFAARYELDKSRKELEQTNQSLAVSNDKLLEQNAALDQANRDIREAEAQIVQSEKMASLGLLAAKIAHEIRNPLNYARMNLDTLRKRFKNLPPEQHAEAGAIVADMSDGFTRIDSIVSDLLTFSQPGGQEPEPVDVAHIFKTTLRYVANQLEEKNIRLEQNLTLGHLIWVNRQQFNQVLVNLLENSIDALSAKEFSGDDQPTITVSCRLENDRQLISIRDNGAGIDPQNLAKIFDPFFTTKDIGKGTGLGLSICFGIVRGYSGNLRVESAPGKFCEFIIDLPANDPSKPAHGNA